MGCLHTMVAIMHTGRAGWDDQGTCRGPCLPWAVVVLLPVLVLVVAGHPIHVGVAYALQRDVVFTRARHCVLCSTQCVCVCVLCVCVLFIGGVLRGWVSCHNLEHLRAAPTFRCSPFKHGTRVDLLEALRKAPKEATVDGVSGLMSGVF